MNTRKSPCEECPWRKDITPGQFPAERYEQLRETTGEPGREVGMDAPLFGCHKSGGPAGDQTIPCAGWLASVGYFSFKVRLALMQGALPAEAMRPGPDWPPLFESYEEMAEFQSGPEGARGFCVNEKCGAYLQWQTVTPGYPCPVCKNAKIQGGDRGAV